MLDTEASDGSAIGAEIDAVPISINRQMAEHFRSRHHRRRRERAGVRKALSGKCPPAGPWRVTFTRIASRKLDDDNLSHSFKSFRDEVAAWLGVDDRDQRVTWVYAQETRRARSVPQVGRYAKPQPKFRVWAVVKVETREAR